MRVAITTFAIILALSSIPLTASAAGKAAPSPTTHDFKPTQFHRLFSGSIAPALRINPGDTVRTWTVDAGGWDSGNRKLSEGGNPQTGPFYIEGALPGDTVAVHLIKVSLNRDTAFSNGTLSPKALDPAYHAAYKDPGTARVIWQLDREHGIARLAEPGDKLKNYTVPLRPMLGCIALAPSAGHGVPHVVPGELRRQPGLQPDPRGHHGGTSPSFNPAVFCSWATGTPCKAMAS